MVRIYHLDFGAFALIKNTPEFEGLTSFELEPATSEQYSLAA
jgi:hypothetical protein